ncbi:MAG: dTDP-glucose 4,6-dehydratase [Candidatus Tectomicrobia bacterium]|uniref:dTDP-glucose 4,6-dehydratase n=1 Tax=Tectimicrobiota bacterium TaxID=2528274 RepID=A0A932FVG0_UNCTE|nr:dTDP-glucose 4,6-dehydratase [Candidatus Tectomicrobia bacterium]
MKLLVTGGAGFMGSNFIRYLLRKYPDYRVVNVDKLTYAGNLENLRDIEADFGDRYQFVRGDIASAITVQTVAKGVDAIINYAAETHVDRSILNPKAFILTDVVGTYTLLEAARHYQVGLYLQIGTDEVYGSIETGAFTEESPFAPNSPYSASKAGADHLVRAYYQTYGLPAIVTHSCNFMGPYQYPEKLIPLFITNLIEGKKVPVYGDGRNVREWIFTEDHCAAVDLLLHQGKAGETYNIGTCEERTNLETTHAILRELGRDEGWIEYVHDRPGHDRRYALDVSKLRGLGWRPCCLFEEAIRATVRWYVENEAWWRRLKDGSYLQYYRQQYGRRGQRREDGHCARATDRS